MTLSLLANFVVLVHFLFIVYVGVGGFLTWRWPRSLWLHGVAVAWGLWILAVGATCPLTPLENALRRQAGDAGYHGGFIDHYIMPVIYPPGLTRGAQMVLAAVVIALNVIAYRGWWRRRKRLGRNGNQVP